MVNNEVSLEEKQYSENIFQLRMKGRIYDAIDLCNEAIDSFGQNNFFYKIKGDLLFTIEKYYEAINCYLDYLVCIRDNPEYFTNFSRFFMKISKVYNVDKLVFQKILDVSRDSSYPDVIRKGLLKIVCDYWPESEEGQQLIIYVNDHYSAQTINDAFSVLKAKDECEKIYFLAKLDDKNCIKENSSINKKVIKAMEEAQMYEHALGWVLHMLKYSNDGVLVRSLFRICRLQNDYSDAIKYMQAHDISKLDDFNVQYELVLFYNAQEDEEKRNQTLQKIDLKYKDSIPIAKTLFNFYVKYNMLEKARAIENRINALKLRDDLGKRKRKEIEKTTRENQDLVWNRLNDLIEEQEHNRQMLAITELIKGFSHELGQPITNIRYSIQIYYMKNAKKQTELDTTQRALLDGILLQTERVGKLLDRFAPIVSSKNEKNYFCVYDEIVAIFDELNIRLENEDINYFVHGDKNSKLYGEKIQFSQIFYNLIINSIYAINKKKVEGTIDVEIQRNGSVLLIRFKDNGIGIPEEIQRKIFDPFYSTKRKDVEEGGEGLGLYIVWNILKMFNGKIYVDPDYSEGAMFVMEIKMEEKDDV